MHKTGFWKRTRHWPRRLRNHSTQVQQTDRDRALAGRLHTAFEKDLDLADIHGIHFYVRNGTVTIYGVVRNELERDLLMSLVRQIPGVKGVVSHLQMVELPVQEPLLPEQEPLPV